MQLPLTRLRYQLLLGILCLCLSSCSGPTQSGTPTSGQSNGPVTPVSGPGTGVQNVQVFVEPDAGDAPIVDAIQHAKKSIWLEIYLLTERNIINALEDAAHAGIDVRVMLEAHPYGSGSISPKETLDKLKATGVKAQSASTLFSLTHEKGMIIDGQAAYIMTCNFTLSALGGSSSTTNREYGIIDTNQPDIQAMSSIFTADWNRTNAQFNDANLVVSPENSRTDFVALINSAHQSLAVEAEEMQDTEVEQALINAARRGIQVQVILPGADSSGNDSNSTGIATLKQGNVQVKEDPHLYMHAKLIVVDGKEAFVGSENISTASLNRNREVGLLVADATVLTTLQQTFGQDWSDSQTV
ncbi:phospholipase D-like domain-containing protein [Tengunoibacter tsumagoiensis]|uniref:phospholipase D n=1 Tax=Tengunoibacter tsumagoiensis TaxID=2014871 RepID=A0A401ZY47_9CHLR|nr:phospholipase D-like domain-containing protein [Tengunoibacter tsumagoiensis]GCE11767.1 hypothetical protein KTT_16260 [Tengunoibacter tsumagoiensis]